VRRPTLALLGERGAEAVIPLSRGGIVGATTVINYYSDNNFNGPLMGDRRQLEEIASRLEPILRRRLG